MIKELQLRIAIHEEKQEDILLKKASHTLKLDKKSISGVKILKKSIDARKSPVIFNYKVAVYIEEKIPEFSSYNFNYKDITKAEPIHIIGFGPAGMYAALRCIELGYKPIVLERGKNVQDRRRDLKAINQDHIVNEDSNYCFGEGGAGTYSDGKLYTRSLKRGDVRRIFENLVYHGATEQILIDAHPHIGTNKLPKVVKNIRETILKYGGEIYFGAKVTDFITTGNQLKALQVNHEKELSVTKVILATGHSARDIYYLLQKKILLLKLNLLLWVFELNIPKKLLILYNIIAMEKEMICYQPLHTAL